MYVPAFGAHLRQLRGDESIAEVCRAIRSIGLALDHSTLIHYERGTVKAPDPALLFALGQHYDVDDVSDLIRLLVQERLGRVSSPPRVFVSFSWRKWSREQRRFMEMFAEVDAKAQSVVLFTLKQFHATRAQREQLPLPIRRRRRST